MPASQASACGSCRAAAGRGSGRAGATRSRIGRADLIAPEIARKKARELAAEVELGGDPISRIKAAKQAKRAKAEKVPDHTMDALWRLYSAGAVEGPAAADAGRLCRRLAAARAAHRQRRRRLDHHRAAAGDARRRSPPRAGKYAANRALAVTSILLALAVKAKWRSDNPARGVERHREHGRERYLSPEEIERLMAVLDQQDDLAAKAIEFLLLSGCRKGEALSASVG